MEISPAQLINPGVFEYDDTRRKQIARFHEAVRRAQFLDDGQKSRWRTMGYLLTNDQLKDGEQMIILEDLRRLKMRQRLERLKKSHES